MQLPKLDNWLDTRLGLHHAAQVIGGVRKAIAQPEPNWTHLGLLIMPEGVTTGSLSQVGTLTLNFADCAIIHQPLQGAARSMPLAGHTQLTLADMIDEALAQTGASIKLDRAKVTSPTPIKVDAALAADYARVLNWVGALLAKFRESLLGERSKL